ncbi:MAG: GNAT family N-acetyltransferase [Bryobacteraceae bacterium]|nr:GNAT family N-acetyltransferase [Bryobacteraceae bacterium]
MKPAPVVLTGRKVELRPLDLDADTARLYEISNGSAQLGASAYDAEAVVWRYMGSGPFDSVNSMRAFLQGLNDTPNLLPLCVWRRDTGDLLGIQTFMSNSPGDLKIELGHIWYTPAAQGTGALGEATYLMLAHAFDLGYQRVEWKCNALNERSRRVALRMGFRFEGIQEAHMIVKNRRRDTAWFRMLAEEWPEIQKKYAAE